MSTGDKRAMNLRDLQELAEELLAKARELPAGSEREEALREIAGYRARLDAISAKVGPGTRQKNSRLPPHRSHMRRAALKLRKEKAPCRRAVSAPMGFRSGLGRQGPIRKAPHVHALIVAAILPWNQPVRGRHPYSRGNY